MRHDGYRVQSPSDRTGRSNLFGSILIESGQNANTAFFVLLPTLPSLSVKHSLGKELALLREICCRHGGGFRRRFAWSHHLGLQRLPYRRGPR
ncbi:hypothetical protein USDA257_c06160 [Sinorhizobium fredii USDA 257]|uniref:Uncharacterized protein n=1 Tax=Sinorhizobium fredii (strain USDA 257) TaxID=1185652 RepID=I3X005_SINF2|nr:hypothetical protein USDA257_c06160 [Sinorhizobium fredii USDA 257]